jgi:hypothetical protein
MSFVGVKEDIYDDLLSKLIFCVVKNLGLDPDQDRIRIQQHSGSGSGFNESRYRTLVFRDFTGVFPQRTYWVT